MESCDCGNEQSGSIKDSFFWVGGCYLLKDSAAVCVGGWLVW